MKQLKHLKRFFIYYRKQTLVISGLFIMVVAIGITCAFNATKEIKVVVDPNTVSADAQVQTAVVAAPLMAPIEEILQQEGYPVSDDYTLSTTPDKKVKDVDSITLKKNAVGELKVDGKAIPYKSGEDTVGELLAKNEVTYDADDQVIPAAETPLTTEVKEIKVARLEVKEEKLQKDIPFEIEEKENATLAEGDKKVSTPGVVGKADAVDKVTYQDGVEIARETIALTPITQPVKEVVDVGTKKPNNTEAIGSDFDLICAIVAHEGGPSYEGALAVISCVMNRVDTGGGSAASVLTAPGQFASYLDGYYTKFMGNAPDYVQKAVRDCMEGGIRSHNYKNFRSYQTSGSECIQGNWFF
ncbi:MAG: G5 domain-containing protein [Eubacterium sp.]